MQVTIVLIEIYTYIEREYHINFLRNRKKHAYPIKYFRSEKLILIKKDGKSREGHTMNFINCLEEQSNYSFIYIYIFI